MQKFANRTLSFQAIRNGERSGGHLAQLVRTSGFLGKVPGSNPVSVSFLFLGFAVDIFETSADASRIISINFTSEEDVKSCIA